ncbi:MAG TPA: lipopolysaccharide biosynthesis protein [Blastocatellia bacterium]|nr:lipopolysaccharide biosynthesis protein [Blastocatellia bacterium]
MKTTALIPNTRPFLGETARQAGMLFSAQTGAKVVGLIASLILARWMVPAEMGRFAFCLAVVTVAGIFFDFGVFSAGARVLALEQDQEKQRRALGALVLMTTALSAAFSIFIAAAAIPIDLIFGKDVRWLLIATAALAFFQPFQYFIELGCQGLNRIRLLSVFQLLMAGVYLLALVALVAVHRVTAGLALGAYLGGMAIATACTIALLRPSFKSASSYIRVTINDVREYGLNLYFARVTGLISTRADQLVIAYFLTDAAPLGIYALGQKFANPIMMMSRSLAMTRFRAFAMLRRVPGRITRWNAAILIASSLALVAFGPPAIRVLFPNYIECASLLLPFALMNIFIGLFQPYNIFLGSHGRGAEIRNIVAVVATASVAGLIITVPRFGIMGAAWTAAAVMGLDYALYVYYYRKFRRTMESAENLSTTATK